MMNNNKILTVSYGTFSCTLEGFDDSFGTMKAIAEYFRDLASDDRYFGAEPPQPDAEMLARIAQKEISRRVEAREDDGRIVLSAQEDVQPAAPAAAPLAVAAAAAVETAETETAPTALQAEPEAVAKPDTESVPETAAEPEASVEPEVSDAAADVEPIAETPAVAAVEEKEVLADTAATDVATVVEDAPVAEDNAPDVEIEENVVAVEEEIAPALESEVEPEEEEPQVAEAPSEPEFEAPVLTAETDTPAADVFEDETTEDAAEAFFANSVLPEDENADEEALYADMAQVQDDVPVAEAVAVETPAIPESIADKLKRIRAVVSQGPIASTQDAEYDAEDGTPATASEDFMSDFMSTPDVDTPQDDPHTSAIAEAAADIESAFEADDAIAEHDAAQDDEDAFVQDISSALERFDAVANDRSDIADATDKAEEEVIDLTGYEVDDAEDDTAADFADLTADTSDEEDIEDVLDNLFEKEDTVQDVLQDEEDETDALMAAATAMNGPAEKTDAPDARLMKVQSSDIENAFEQYVEDAEDHADSTLQADVASAAEDSRSAVDSLPKLEEGQDTDLSRLMAEADSQMKEPESAGRRKAFAHLRAAVAAKKADRQMGTDDTLEASDQPYRSDLADAVKPRRPIVGATSRTERPAMDATSAPLKLVAEQRVDVQRPDGPVKPRRIAASQEELIADAAGESFNTFADEMGATKLPELLEAAAAYLSFVEGHDQFSRPQLMTKVRQVENETFSREDSLRSFGQLLRSGKIQKIKGGRFTVSEDIGFKPDERAAS